MVGAVALMVVVVADARAWTRNVAFASCTPIWACARELLTPYRRSKARIEGSRQCLMKKMSPKRKQHVSTYLRLRFHGHSAGGVTLHVLHPSMQGYPVCDWREVWATLVVRRSASQRWRTTQASLRTELSQPGQRLEATLRVSWDWQCQTSRRPAPMSASR
jgi:hypothetical protein